MVEAGISSADETATLTQVLPSMVGPLWDRIAPQLSKGIDESYGALDLTELLGAIVDGRYQLWAIHQDAIIMASAVSAINRFPEGDLCLHIFLAGGDRLHEWMDASLDAIAEWAAGQGCSGLRVTGRRGWERLLKPHGYEFRYVTLERKL